MTVDSIYGIGIHQSVDAFDPEILRTALADLEIPVRVLDQDGPIPTECNGVVTLHDSPEFAEAELSWIHLISAGVDHFPVEHYTSKGVVVTNSSGIHAECMAENAIGLMLTHAHRLAEFLDAQRDAKWRRDLAWQEKFTLHGRTLCVVGLGAIGQKVAEYGSALGMEVCGVRRSAEPVEHVETLYTDEELPQALSKSRFVVVCVPLTDETRSLISTTELETMPENSFLINISRGTVVDEEAVLKAVRSDTISGAALDVFETEPLPEKSPLWSEEDILVMPHVSGAFSHYHEGIADLVRENVIRFRNKEPLQNRVGE